MLSNNHDNSNINRRYSLFNNSSVPFIKKLSRHHERSGSPAEEDFDESKDVLTDMRKMSNPLNRRNTAIELASNSICQKCKEFEIDLNTASDSLNATDAELKASRQVISLLQRQLELFQVEKEGLERLVVSQSSNNLISTEFPPTAGVDLEQNKLNPSELSVEPVNNLGNNSSDGVQRKLLGLIKTQLYAKDEEIVRLKSSVKEARNEKEQLNVRLDILEDDLAKLKSENNLLKENLALRDQTIVSLSNEVFEQTNSNDKSTQRRQSSVGFFSNQVDSKVQQKQIARLSETLEAYKKTNELLNQNVIELTEKCAQTERKEIETRSQCQELEAKCCQIQSKLLSLLKEIEQSSKQANIVQDSEGEDKIKQEEVIHSESVKLLIKRLLEDKSLDIPLSWKEGNKCNRSNEECREPKLINCDELGFYLPAVAKTQSDGATILTPAGIKASSSLVPARSRKNTMRRGLSDATGFGAFNLGQSHLSQDPVSDLSGASYNSVDARKNDELAWRSQWDDFIKDFNRIDIAKSAEFKRLLRTGVPQEYRCKVWKALIDLKIGEERRKYGKDFYQGLLEQPRTKQVSGKTQNTLQNPSSKQIELDLLRTLPNNKYFETIDSSGTVRLRRVLLAFAAHEPHIGYCQGMNRLAAVALLVLPEEEAFWCLVAIVDKIMPTGYYNDLWLAQVDSNVIMDFVAMKMPDLSEHFAKYGIELSLFAWFLTIFVDGTPPALFLRLWDCFLYEGDKVMFRIALALMKKFEYELLKINNSVTANNFLQSIVNGSIDIDEIFQIAFEFMNPLPARLLRSKREQNFQSMRSMYRSYSTQSQTDSGKPYEVNESNKSSKAEEIDPLGYQDADIV